MIGIFNTIHPTEGYGLTVRFRRIDGVIKILSITMASGKDAWGQLTSEKIQNIKNKIPK